MAGTRGQTRRLFSFFLLAAFFHLFPLGLYPADSVNEPVDCLLNTWIITWTHLNLAKNPRPSTTPIFLPQSRQPEHLGTSLSLAVLSWPVFLASRNPILSYNFLLFLFITLNGFTMFLLLKAFDRKPWVGIMGGLMFAFNSYQIQHISHLQLQSSWLIPLAFLSLHKFFIGRRLKHSLLFAFLLFLLTLCCVYYGLFMISILLAVLPLILLATSKAEPGFLLKLIAPLMLFGLLTLFFARPYFFHVQKLPFPTVAGQRNRCRPLPGALRRKQDAGPVPQPAGEIRIFPVPGNSGDDIRRPLPCP